MGDLPAAVPEEGIVKSYWQQLGEKLGAYAEPLAIVLLDLMSENPSGTQLFRVNWHRGEVKPKGGIRLVAEEIDVEPQPVVDKGASTAV
jgi:hypothetical protein